MRLLNQSAHANASIFVKKFSDRKILVLSGTGNGVLDPGVPVQCQGNLSWLFRTPKQRLSCL